MRVGVACAVAGEMLGDRRHAGLAHAREIGGRQRARRIRVAVKRAVPDDLAQPVVQIHAGGEAEIDPNGAQLGGHEPADRVGGKEPLAPVRIEAPAEQAYGRQGGEALAEALDAPPLLVDRDQKVWGGDRSYCGAKGRYLLWIPVVACEQDDAADKRM